MIQDYLDRLSRELDFDRSLSRCVRQEVEDHLWEAVGAGPAQDSLEAQRRVIANFGDARMIAAQFAVVSLARRSRRAGLAGVLVIVAVFVAMKVRLVWYAATQLAIGDELRAISAPVSLIDRYAFWSALMIGLGGWLYIRSRQIPATLHPAYRRQLRRFVLSCGATAAALVVSVISDAVLTALQLRGTGLSATSLVPILSMAIEIACVGFLIVHIRSVAHRRPPRPLW
jgi:HAAS